MFFPERIKSIKSTDKVLEIGPGATPYFRSDVFLELNYATDQERIAQSGRVGILNTEKPVFYYDGDEFPFKDKEFDYVVCSHVLEHVSNADDFLKEVQRVGSMGYLEFPTVYYDYIYNFPEHQLFLLENNGVINWMTKEESGLGHFAKIQEFFFKSCQLKYYDTIHNFKDYFFQGFEWHASIKSQRVYSLDTVTFSPEKITLKPNEFDDEEAKKMYPKISLKKFLKYRINKRFKKS